MAINQKYQNQVILETNRGTRRNALNSMSNMYSQNFDPNTSEGLVNLAIQQGGMSAEVIGELAHPQKSILTTIGDRLKNLGKGFIDIIETPNEIIAGTIMAIGDPTVSLGQGIKKTVMEDITASTALLGEYNKTGKTGLQKTGNFVFRFALDTLLDPLTFLSGGPTRGIFGLSSSPKFMAGKKLAEKLGIRAGKKVALAEGVGDDLKRFVESSIRGTSKIGEDTTELVKRLKKAGISDDILKESVEEAAEGVRKFLDNKVIDIDTTNKALSDLMELHPALAETVLDKGGIKFFGKTVLEAQKIRFVKGAIPGMTMLDKATEPYRMALQSVFDPHVVKAPNGKGYRYIPDDVLQVQKAQDNLIQKVSADHQRRVEKVIRNSGIRNKDELQSIMASVSTGKMPANEKGKIMYNLINDLNVEAQAKMKALGINYTYLPNYNPRMLTKTETTETLQGFNHPTLRKTVSAQKEKSAVKFTHSTKSDDVITALEKEKLLDDVDVLKEQNQIKQNVADSIIKSDEFISDAEAEIVTAAKNINKRYTDKVQSSLRGVLKKGEIKQPAKIAKELAKLAGEVDVKNVINTRLKESYKGGLLAKKIATLDKATGDSVIRQLKALDVDTAEVEKLIKKATKDKDTTKSILSTQAKKYESAEEFIKAQGKSVYHGTLEKDALSIEKAGFKTRKELKKITPFADDDFFGDVVYLTDNKHQAQRLGEQMGTERGVSTFQGVGVKVLDIPVGNLKLAPKPKGIKSLKEFQNAIKKLKEQGFDGVYEKAQPGNWNIVWNKNKLKTKSQLEQIWKKARGKKAVKKTVEETSEEATEVVRELVTGFDFDEATIQRFAQKFKDEFELDNLGVKKLADKIIKNKQLIQDAELERRLAIQIGNQSLKQFDIVIAKKVKQLDDAILKLEKEGREGSSVVIEGIMEQKEKVLRGDFSDVKVHKDTGELYLREAASYEDIRNMKGYKVEDIDYAESLLSGPIRQQKEAYSKAFTDDIARFGVDAAEAPSHFVFLDAEKIGVNLTDQTGEVLKTIKFDPVYADAFETMIKSLGKDMDTGVFGKAWDSATNVWKSSVTSMFPAFHMRNGVSNVMLNMLDTGFEALNPDTWAKGVDVITKNEQIVKLIDKKNIAMSKGLTDEAAKIADDIARINNKTVITDRLGHTWTFGELREQLIKRDVAFTRNSYNIKADQIVNKKGTVTGKILSKGEKAKKFLPVFNDFYGYKAGHKFGSHIENHGRLMNFLTNLKATGDVGHAAARTKQFLFDYGNLTTTERDVLRRIIPFYSFTRFNLELQAKVLATKPGRIAQQIRLFDTFTDVFSQETLTDEQKELLPDWMKRGFSYIKKQDDGTLKLKTGFESPSMQPFEALSRKGILGSISPLIRAPLEQLTGYDMYQGKVFSEATNAASYKLAPKALKNFIGYEEINFVDPYTGKEVTWSVSLRPNRMNLVNNLPPTSRVISSLRDVGSDDKTVKEKAMKLLFGTSSYDVDFDRLERQREKELLEQYTDILDTANVVYQFKKNIISK